MQKNAGFLELNWYKPAETAKPLVYAKSQPKNPSKRGPQVLQFEVNEVMVRAMLFFPILRKPLGLLPVLKKRSWKGKKKKRENEFRICHRPISIKTPSLADVLPSSISKLIVDSSTAACLTLSNECKRNVISSLLAENSPRIDRFGNKENENSTYWGYLAFALPFHPAL